MRVPGWVPWALVVVLPFAAGAYLAEDLGWFGRGFVPGRELEMVTTKDLHFADYSFQGIIPPLTRCVAEGGGLLAGTPVRVRQMGRQFNLIVAGSATSRRNSPSSDGDEYFGLPLKPFGQGSPEPYYERCSRPTTAEAR
jgi:hypothetical protein